MAGFLVREPGTSIPRVNDPPVVAWIRAGRRYGLRRGDHSSGKSDEMKRFVGWLDTGKLQIKKIVLNNSQNKVCTVTQTVNKKKVQQADEDM